MNELCYYFEMMFQSKRRDPINNPEKFFILCFLVFIVMFGVIIVGLSIAIDPWGIFGTNLVKPLAITDRTEKLQLLSRYNPKPEIIILGSSRTRYINPSLIEEYTKMPTFNASVGFARSEEYYALSKYIIEKLSIKPKIFFVGFNVAEFNYDDMEPQSINSAELRPYLNISTRKYIETAAKVLKNSFNIKYIKDIVKTVFYNADGYPETALKFIENGYVDVARHPPKLEGSARRHDPTSAIKLFNNMPSVSPFRKEYFEKFLAFTRDNNINVISVILPIPQEILQTVKEKTGYQKAYEEFLAYLGGLETDFPHFKFYDFSTTGKFDGLEENFGDSSHPGAFNLDLITTRVFEDYKS